MYTTCTLASFPPTAAADTTTTTTTTKQYVQQGIQLKYRRVIEFLMTG